MADTTPSHKPMPAEAGSLATTQTHGDAPDAGVGGSGGCGARGGAPGARGGGSGGRVEPGGLSALLGPPRGAGEIGWLRPCRMRGVLGAGGIGVGFRAEDHRLKHLIALKALRHDRAVLTLNR